MLTPKQATLYWRTWAAICTTQGWERGDNECRYQVHQHCRCPQSMRDFTNRDFSRFLSLSAPLRDVVDIKKRDEDNCIHTIEHSGLDEAYVLSICRDLYKTSAWRDLPLRELENLRDVVVQRARKKARASRPPSSLVTAPAELDPF